QYPWVLYKKKKGTLVDSYTAEKKKFRQNPPSAATNRITDEILKTTKNMTPTECHLGSYMRERKEHYHIAAKKRYQLERYKRKRKK
ncbi:4819_t:CDS:2, partial [Gigaspora margarita]